MQNTPVEQPITIDDNTIKLLQEIVDNQHWCNCHYLYEDQQGYCDYCEIREDIIKLLKNRQTKNNPKEETI